jgi:hypothetical protein
MKNKLYLLIFISIVLIYLSCSSADNNGSAKKDLTAANYSATISFGPVPPTVINNPADPMQAAEFAWKEFIALTWPVKVNPSPAPGLSAYFRGQPSSTDSSGSTGSGGLVVWETFYHRAELYPDYFALSGNKLPNADTIPNYFYGGPIPSINGANQNLFNNMDEASEINLAYMYYTPLAQKVDSIRKSITGSPSQAQLNALRKAQIKAGLVYEAKGNSVFYQYLDTTGFNNDSLRALASNNSINLLTKNIPPSGKLFNLPNGTTEIKATWRRYDASADNLNDFHWTVGIYYTADSQMNIYANNDTFLLISLHIIQKTPNVPTFTFATFEHISNEKNGFRYLNTNPGVVTGVLPRPLPDSFIRTAARQFPIPDSTSAFNLVGFNHSVQQQLRAHYGNNNVWANYELIGVQAVVQDDSGGVVPAQQFFLSNFATETNDALQFFQGGLSGPASNVPDPNAAHVFVYNPNTKQYVGHSSGGCLGCHGSQGQFVGGDFSVISSTTGGGNNFYPQPVTPYAGGQVYPQNPSGFPLPHTTQVPHSAPKLLYYIPPHKNTLANKKKNKK